MACNIIEACEPDVTVSGYGFNQPLELRQSIRSADHLWMHRERHLTALVSSSPEFRHP